MEIRDGLSSSTSSNHQSPPHDFLLNLATGSFQAQNVKTAMQKRKAGRKKFQVTRHPIYKGVRRRNGKWVCELRHPNSKTRIWLGTFSSPDMAARAHDAAALALRRDSAVLNFPESAHLLPKAMSTSIKDIQCAALKAAENKGCAHHFDQLVSSLSSSSFSSLSCVDDGKEKGEEGCRKLFWDEEELFNMPALINSMAEGLILTPPALQRGFNWDAMEDAVDLTLWSD